MSNLTSFNSLLYSILLNFYIKVHGLVAAHKKNLYEGTDFSSRAPMGAVYHIDYLIVTFLSLTAMRTCGIKTSVIVLSVQDKVSTIKHLNTYFKAHKVIHAQVQHTNLAGHQNCQSL